MPDQPLAIALKDAPNYVPFSKDYIFRAIRRTEGNVLRARLAGGKYVITTENLRDWVQKEGVES